MRKYSWLVVLFAILAFVFTGLLSCGEGVAVEVAFHAGDGYFSNGLGFKRLYTGSNGRLTLPDVPVYDGFKFREWNTSANGHGGQILSASTVHTEFTLYYAIWDQDSFNVTETWDYSGTPPVHAPSFNTWTIDGEKITAIKAAEPGSMLRLHFDATGGTGSDRNGWGIGTIGNGGNDIMDFLPLNAPSGSALIYFIDVENNWLLDILDLGDGTKLIVSTHLANGDMFQKAELLEPKEERGNVAPRPGKPALPKAELIVPPDPEGEHIANIVIDYGMAGDIAQGKGYISGDQLELMKETVANLQPDERVLMRLWTRNDPIGQSYQDRDTSSWTDCGRIGGDYDQGALGIQGGPLNTALAGEAPNNDRAHLYSDAQVRHLLGLGRDLFLNPYNGNIITLIELWVVPYRYLEIMVGGTKVSEIIVTGRGGNVTYLPDNSGIIFGPTGDSRASYSWFELDFGAGKKLGDYKELQFDYDVITPASNSSSVRIALIASIPALGGANLTAHITGGSGQEAPLGSSNGWLAAFQVSAPMMGASVGSDVHLGVVSTPAFHNVNDVPADVTLNILTELPAYVTDAGAATTLTNTLASQKLYFSIYENTRDAVVKIYNIRFVEK